MYNGGDVLEDVDGIFKKTAVQKLLWGRGGRREGVGLVWSSEG